MKTRCKFCYANVNTDGACADCADTIAECHRAIASDDCTARDFARNLLREMGAEDACRTCRGKGFVTATYPRAVYNCPECKPDPKARRPITLATSRNSTPAPADLAQDELFPIADTSAPKPGNELQADIFGAFADAAKDPRLDTER